MSRFVDALIHPSVVDDDLRAPRHRAFLIATLVAGTAALILLPLYLALVGPTSLPLTLGLAWAIGQWPLAMYLSRTGNLAVAHGASAGLFAVFIGAMCALTGGIQSFAVVWLLMAPLEAALSGERRVVVLVAILCAAEAAALALFAQPVAVFGFAGHIAGHETVSALFALAYASMLALRIGLEQHRSENLVRDRDQRLKLLSENVDDLVAVLGEGGDVLSLAGPADRLLGAPARLIRTDGLFQRVHVADRPLFLKTVSDAACDEVPRCAELRIRTGATRPGEVGIADYRWMEMTCRRPPVRSGASASGTVVAVLRDISARRLHDDALAAERSAAEATSAARTRFLASIGQELRTPLNAILGFADLLRAGSSPSDDSRSRKYIDLIHQSGTHLLQMVEDLLDMSKIEAGRYDLSIEPFDLPQCLETCRHMLATEASGKGIEIVTEVDNGLGAFPADRRACMQIVLSLLSNAVKFGASGSRMVLCARRDRDRVELSVRDSGPGIAATDLPRLGQSYFRTRDPALCEAPGTGLGLSVVKALAELYGGAMTVDSLPGTGTCVTVTLPLRTAHAGAAGEVGALRNTA
ncbi:PAS domain-containing sensor histidine kinase [Polymorphum gilvum]|uniref:PAS domain-containing sensor histidine kinase n=1 Tax=Polymorphum gilvum TaxID=991904 RepID=UPI0011D25F4C|nr:HAMP domain-containing sensor histidine kinase [Polymorphum gilvum]